MNFSSKIILALALIVFVSGAEAAPPSPQAPPLPADSTSAGIDRFSIKSTSTLRFTETYQLGETGLSSAYMGGGGWIYNSNLNISKKKFRGRDMSMIFENFLGAASKNVSGLYTLRLSVEDMYSRQTSLGISQYGKEIIMETKSAGAELEYQKARFGASKTKFFVSGTGSGGQQDFKYNKTFEAETGGYQNYRMGDKIGLSGGFGTSFKREASDVGPIEFNGITSRVDTIRAALEIGGGDTKFLAVKYSKKMGTLRKVDPPLGNSMQILDNPEDAKKEENRLKGELLEVEMEIEPLDYLSVKVEFEHNYSDDKYLVEDRRNKEIETNDLSGSIAYRYCDDGSLAISMTRGESDTEYGPTSVASYRIKDYMLNGSVKHTLHDSLSVSLRGSMTLKQKFFKKKEQNPRDADYLSSSLSGTINAYLFRVIRTSITGLVSRRETINIDATLSGDNRVDSQYKFVPELSITPARWVTLKQAFEIKMDYTEFTFEPDKNYLNRNTVLTTDASFMIARPLLFRFSHMYQMKDTGSYLLREGGTRLYGPTNENFEHKLSMDLRYTPKEDMTFFVETQFKDQVSNSVGFLDGKKVIRSSSPSESGNFRIGAENKTEFTDRGRLDLDIAYVKRYGPFISEDRRQFWEIQANFTLDF
ncbi:MAG: hypothetical protein JW746_04000 [Candidatus Krumholzibacteriota bacterium]|nr:hypothetical protein [Candidatus Krumholzibacteriota bacterium]